MEMKSAINAAGYTWKKLFQIALCILLFICLESSNSVAQSYVEVDKPVVLFGQVVEININHPQSESVELFIKIGSDEYKFLGELKKTLYYTPQKKGTYTLTLKNKETKEAVSSLNFNVVDIIQVVSNENSQILSTNKVEYMLNEGVTISLNFDVSRSFDVSINSPFGSFKYLGTPGKTIQYIPKVEGKYSINVYFKDTQVTYSASFNVLNVAFPGINIPPEPQAEKDQRGNEDELFIKDKDNNQIDVSVSSFDFNMNKVDVRQEDTKYDWILIPDDFPLKKIEVESLAESEVKKIIVEDISEDIKSIPGKRWIEVVGIDLSFVEKTQATITFEASGNELFICNIWDSPSQECKSQWKKSLSTSVGKEYSIEVVGESVAYGQTGVATINSQKPIYHPNEHARMIIVILDRQGYLIDNALLEVTITDPKSKKYVISSSDYPSTINRIKRGVFEFTYDSTSLTGRYGIQIKANSDLVDFSMATYFDVKDTYEFDIIRNIPATIDPWSGPFNSQIEITPLIETGIYDFTEVIPLDFKITNTGNAEIRELSGKRLMIWKNLNGRSTVSYSLQSPYISPNLYVFGQSYVSYEKGLFYEARPWYLAIDPPSIINVRGIVYMRDGITGAANGIPITLNNSNLPSFVKTYVNAPPPTPGAYATTIQGSNNDDLIGFAWNNTHYGRNSTILVNPTTRLNIIINTTRGSEPNVTILYPFNSSIFNTSINFTLNATIQILGSDGINCNATISFFPQYVVNISQGESFTHYFGNIGWLNRSNSTWNITPLSEGKVNITVLASCASDGVILENRNSQSVYNISIGDTVPPVIVLIHPQNNSFFPYTNITFIYNVTDFHSGVSNCSLFIDNLFAINDSTILEDTPQNFTYNVTYGMHNYSIQCTDNSTRNNTGLSYFNYFNVTDYDLFINSSLINFSTQTPFEGENITIFATIFNRGTQNISSSFIVQFFENDPNFGGLQINGNITVFGLNFTQSIIVNTSYIVKIGSYPIFVMVDIPLLLNGSVLEADETNNIANTTVNVSIWQVYFGDTLSELVLDNSLNYSIFIWPNSSKNNSGNVYLTDYDSQISWANLTPLGRDKNNLSSFNDFKELDIALNTSQYADSINNSFTVNSISRDLANFTIQRRLLINVSVVNSTNTSNFLTGILWDGDDLSILEFNGTQDVVFLTKIQYKLQGKYGNYDYELRIPGYLKNYQLPNTQFVTLYTEIA